MKVIGVLLGVFLALFILWMGFSFLWWQNNHEEVMQAVDQAVIEGQEIGKDSTDAECLTIYLDIMRDCQEMTCSIQNQVFLKTCLEYSQATSGFCATIPPKKDLIDFAKWAAKQCLNQQVENSHCAAGLQEAAIYCEQPLSQ